MVVRDAIGADMTALRDMYNSGIESTTVAWPEQQQTLCERRRWFVEQRRNGHPPWPTS